MLVVESHPLSCAEARPPFSSARPRVLWDPRCASAQERDASASYSAQQTASLYVLYLGEPVGDCCVRPCRKCLDSPKNNSSELTHPETVRVKLEAPSKKLGDNFWKAFPAGKVMCVDSPFPKNAPKAMPVKQEQIATSSALPPPQKDDSPSPQRMPVVKMEAKMEAPEVATPPKRTTDCIGLDSDERVRRTLLERAQDREVAAKGRAMVEQMGTTFHERFQPGHRFKLDPGHWLDFQQHLAQGAMDQMTCQHCWDLLASKDITAARVG